MKHKPYRTIDDVPLGKWNLIVIALKHNRKDLASKLFNEVLLKIKDIPQFEVFLLTRKLCQSAGIIFK
jgi:hypothetical protein